MVKIITDCSPGPIIPRKAANLTIVGTLVASAFYWDFGVPQMIYDHVHPRVSPVPGVQFLPRRDPPDWLSYVSSDHAVLVERAFNG